MATDMAHVGKDSHRCTSRGHGLVSNPDAKILEADSMGRDNDRIHGRVLLDICEVGRRGTIIAAQVRK